MFWNQTERTVWMKWRIVPIESRRKKWKVTTITRSEFSELDEVETIASGFEQLCAFVRLVVQGKKCTSSSILDGSSSHHHIMNVMDHFGYVCFHRTRPNKVQTAMCSEEDRLNTEQRLQCVQKKIDPIQNRSCHVFRRRSTQYKIEIAMRSGQDRPNAKSKLPSSSCFNAVILLLKI